jgi:hypothetical protein
MNKAYIFVLLFLIFISTSDLFSQVSDMESMMPSPNKEESPIYEKRMSNDLLLKIIEKSRIL